MKEHQKCILCKKTTSSFNFKCKLPSMINIKKKKCIVCKKVSASFNFPGNKTLTHCFKCKEEGMENIHRRNCIKCKKDSASFNVVGSPAKYCSSCKTDDMINVCMIRCTVCKNIGASYTLIGNATPTHCFKCKSNNMVNLRARICIVCKETTPSYKYPNDKGPPRHCFKCKLPGMYDCKHKKCVKCKDSSPIYNLPGEKAKYCINCKTDNMVDVLSKKCEWISEDGFETCSLFARFGFPLHGLSMCINHKKAGMMRSPNKRCFKKGCTGKVEYGIKIPFHCFEHKGQEDINLIQRDCLKCGRIETVNEEQICINFCLKDVKGYRAYKKNIKTKEERVVEVLNKECGIPSSVDSVIQTISGKKNKSRPDIVYNCKTHIVIVECDEFAHRTEKKIDEDNRMRNVYRSFEGKPVVFVRFNPDIFRDSKGTIAPVPQKEKEEMLVSWVKTLRKTIPKNPLSVLYLYYNGYKKSDGLLVIDPDDEKEYHCTLCNKYFYIESVFRLHTSRCCLGTPKIIKKEELSHTCMSKQSYLESKNLVGVEC
jgi:Holliday junction resolvase